ncbi:peptide ABC transporter substrate-binding protein [Lihuaxuella thermophila]|uniref:Oligopeptide transport system substrate-binding protein n=1 Tax=Lihuaxuella thermophila TaxID=1173111 RepID=A0A1H8HL54_9BACL|nr:peptide ABC transporter substrate-binding protein [Lihuaxuella thermophila]SEN56826.1 oligopeptide transport system substrate-binding protein [Lihuaxuella thermophila]
MNQKKWRALLGIVLSAGLLLSGCNSFTPAGSSGESVLSDNQTLRMAESQELISLDSAKAADVASFNILNNVQEGLMRIGKEKKPEYGIAQEVEISPDKKTYTFKLREDAVWSDGKPVTAHDFEYAWKRALDPATKSEYAYILYPIVNAEEYNTGKAKADQVGIKATDNYTLVVKLKEPKINFLSMTTLSVFYPQRKDIVEKFKDQYGMKPDRLVYNGPFTVKEWKPQKVVLVKNEKYWDRNAVSLKQVDVHIVKDAATGINLYNSGQIDTAPLTQAFVDAYKQTPDYVDVELATTTYILFNHEKAFFKNDKIRKAISLAIDRDEIAESIMKDGSKPAGSLIPHSLNGYGNKSFRNGEVVKRDVAKAKELFNQGLAELGLSKPPTDITMISYDSTARKDVALYVKEQLRTTLGLEIKLDAPTWKVHLDKLKTGNFQMGMLSWSADYNDPIGHFEIWQTSNPFNWSKFSNAKYDQLVNQAKKETNQKKQYELLLEAEKILAGTEGEGQAGFVPLFYQSKAYVQKPYVKDLYRHAYGAEYSLKWAYIAKAQEKN